MIEEASIVAVHARIDDRLRVDDEQERMAVVRVLLFVAAIRLVVRHPLANVLDDASAFGNALCREHAETVHVGAPDLDELGGGEIGLDLGRGHGQTATGALIAA